MDLTGEDAATTIANGVVPTSVTGARSLCSRYFCYVSIAINWLMVLRNMVWPSGADFASNSTAMSPVAPGDCPR